MKDKYSLARRLLRSSLYHTNKEYLDGDVTIVATGKEAAWFILAIATMLVVFYWLTPN